MTFLDLALLNSVESLCQKFQVLTGRTNVWLAIQLTNLSVVVYFVWATLFFWRNGLVGRILLGVFFGGLLYLLTQTVFKDSIELHESNAYRRVSKGLRNPRRVRDAILRISFLTLCVFLSYPVVFAYVLMRLYIVLLTYSLVVLTTAVLYLLACDPLPPCPAKLTAWFRKPVPVQLRSLRSILFTATLSTSLLAADAAPPLARVRLILSTTAKTVAVTLDGATLASYRPFTVNPSDVHATHTGRTMQMSNPRAGESADATFDVVLADVPPGAAITWHLDADASAQTRLEVYALADFARPVLVDRFDSTGGSAEFTTRTDPLRSRAAVSLPPVSPLVLAHYYPWYTMDTWRDPRMADQPLRLYSTDEAPDVSREIAHALSAGIDVFVSSWREWPAEVGDPSDRSMRVLLDAARPTRMKVAVYTESFTANAALDWSTAEPATMEKWIADIVDRYGSDPAYLHVDGRPVVFVYAATLVPLDDWTALSARLRATGRNPLLIGDFFESRLIEVFDGQYRYSTVSLSADDLADVDLHQSLRARTFGLLQPADRRRIWVAPVSPGADDRLLTDRTDHQVVDRDGGRLYDRQWATAINTGADWVMVTSWNEWWENTEIEPSRRYGTAYLDATRRWVDIFKSDTRDGRSRKRASRRQDAFD